MNWPLAITSRGLAARLTGPARGNRELRTNQIWGRTSRSQKESMSCFGRPLSMFAFRSRSAATARPMSSGWWRVSASVKMSRSPLAAWYPCQHAQGLPNQPGGSASPRTTCMRGSIAASASAYSSVPSALRSSTTMTSTAG